MMMGITEAMFKCYRDCWTLTGKLKELYAEDLIDPQLFDQTMMKICKNSPDSFKRIPALELLQYFRRMLKRIYAFQSIYKAKVIVRHIRGIVGRLAIACFEDYDLPKESLIEILGEMPETSEFNFEFRESGAEFPVYLKQVKAFLEFEFLVDSIPWDTCRSERNREITKLYAKCSKPTNFCAFSVLTREMADVYTFNVLTEELDKEARYHDTNIIFRHLEGRRNARIVMSGRKSLNKPEQKSALYMVKRNYEVALRSPLKPEEKVKLWDFYLMTMDDLRNWSDTGLVLDFWQNIRIAAAKQGFLNDRNAIDFFQKFIKRCAPHRTVATIVTDFLMLYDSTLVTPKVIPTVEPNKKRIGTLLTNFLKSVMQLYGLAHARTLLGQYYTKRAPLKFFEFLLEAEINAENPNLVCIRRCFEEALIYHGHYSEELWKTYIRFELSRIGTAARVAEIYFRAKIACSEAINTGFLAEFHKNETFRKYVPEL